MSIVRERIEQGERALLSPRAVLASESTGRLRPEDPDPIRTCFQRDRDRILHCKAFRRLKHKTQVFIDPTGDHYRTRLTHTLEVSQIARTIARALGLNEDLTEAIALGHDVGHPPFGHAGEEALDETLAQHPGEGPSRFRHYEQSLRIVDVLENLNLTEEVRAGIGGHSKGRADLSDQDGQAVSSLEAAVVRISDRIAYLNHDLDDALRSGILAVVPTEFVSLGTSHGHRIGHMVEDIVANSLGEPMVRMSAQLLMLLNRMKDWLFGEVYTRYPLMYPEIPKAKMLVSELLIHYLQPGTLPGGYSGRAGAIDYVAGMTDRFAMAEFLRLRMPKAWQTLETDEDR